MPTVPDYSRRADAIQPVRQARMNPADAARPGQELADLGKSLSVASNTVGDILLKQQEQKDLDAVFQAETQLKTWETGFHNSVRERKGRNADGATEEAVKSWDEQARKIGGSLATERQRRAFDRIAAERRNSSLDFVSRHQSQELREARIQGAEADIEATIQAGIANPGAADLNSTAIERAYRALEKTEGLDPDYVSNKIQAATTAMHKGVISAMIDQSPGGARAYYNQHKDGIKPSERGAIEKALREGGVKEFSQRKATELVSKYGDDYESALADARANIKDADRQEATVSQIKARYAEFKSFEADRQKKAFEAGLDLANKGQISAIEHVPQHLVEMMAPADYVRLKDHLKAKVDAVLAPPKHDDPEKLYEAQRLIEQGDIYDERQLRIYDPYLTDSGRKALRTMVTKQNEVSSSVVLAEFESRIGKTRAQFLKSAGTREQWAAFQRFVYDRVRGEARPQDIQNLADDFFIKMYRPGSGVWGIGRDTTTLGEAEVAGRQGYVAEIPDADAPTFDRSIEVLGAAGVAVPRNEVERGAYYAQTYLPAVRHLQRMGVAVTGDAVSAYLIMKNNKIQITPETLGIVIERLNK